MAKINLLPPIVQQYIETIKDPKTPEHIRFNYVQNIENIRDCCDQAAKDYRNGQLKIKKR